MAIASLEASQVRYISLFNTHSADSKLINAYKNILSFIFEYLRVDLVDVFSKSEFFTTFSGTYMPVPAILARLW